jgi:hypothetical protein
MKRVSSTAGTPRCSGAVVGRAQLGQRLVDQRQAVFGVAHLAPRQQGGQRPHRRRGAGIGTQHGVGRACGRQPRQPLRRVVDGGVVVRAGLVEAGQRGGHFGVGQLLQAGGGTGLRRGRRADDDQRRGHHRQQRGQGQRQQQAARRRGGQGEAGLGGHGISSRMGCGSCSARRPRLSAAARQDVGRCRETTAAGAKCR